MDGGQSGGLHANGELRTVEVRLGSGLTETEKSVAVASELHSGGTGEPGGAWGSPGMAGVERKQIGRKGWPCKHCCYSL